MISFLKRLVSSVPTPSAGKVILFVDEVSGEPSYKDETGISKSLKGDVGGDGPPATITDATAIPLAAGAAPTVTLGGTDSARTFTFGIPAGADGQDGQDGEDGEDGINATITVVTTVAAFNAATPGPSELVVLANA